MDYVLILLAIAAIVLFVRRFRIYEGIRLAISLAFVVVGVMVFFVESGSLYTTAALTVGVLLFGGILGSRNSYARLACVLLCIVYIADQNGGLQLVSQSVLIGLLSSVDYRMAGPAKKRSNIKLETERDIVHIAAGILIIAVFILLPLNQARYLFVLGVLIGIAVIAYADMDEKGSLYMSLIKLERRGSRLGSGALWLALGSLLAVSFLSSGMIITVLAAILIGDPIATFVGTRLRGPKLPYNRSKSISGSTAYFAATALIAFPFVGIIAIPVALAAAFVESVELGIDDNFVVALVLSVVIKFILFI